MKMKRIEQVFETVRELCAEQYLVSGQILGIPTDAVVNKLGIQRSNASGDLNNLVKAERLKKVSGKPVLYKTTGLEVSPDVVERSVLDNIIGADKSLKTAIQQAKAAVMYPPLGLHTLLLGETGVGKSMFAEAIFRYAQDIGRLKANAPFIAFNCADYAHNPQLLLAQLFGVRKGSYTGAERDKAGLVEKADHGILLLDEVHRLPPEGQEMLFYLIDKGLYRSLGEVEEYKKVEVLIICATTENTDSSLLRTFTRRIPMIIKLPSVRERKMNERWELIKSFFKHEAQCLKVPISVSPNSFKAFLLYDCPNNIGQLKSDIKLSCARAFLDYISSREKVLKVGSEDLPEHVRRGFVKYKEYRGDIDKIGLSEDMVFTFAKDINCAVRHSDTTNIYEALEQKIKTLKSKGLSEEDIQLIMGLDIDVYIKRYMTKFRKANLEELYKIVDRKVVDVTQEFLQYAMEKTDKQLDDRILFGMAIHISSALERIRGGKEIVNPQLAGIKKSYAIDFTIAKYFGVLLENNFGVTIPPDEIGFITMFLVFDDYMQKEAPGRVGIIVAMHGDSTASSMAEVANRLLGEKHAIGYDVPLDQKPEEALEQISQLVRQHNEGQGVLMLVDMGSLVMFGDIIYERTAIPIKTIEMSSTPMVLEAVRKALMLVSLEEIYHAVTNLSPYIGRMYWNNLGLDNKLKDDVIVTACITGKGTAIKLKNIIEKTLTNKGRQIDILPIEIINVEDYNRKLAKIKQEKNLVAIVSSIRPQDTALKYISMKELIEGKLDILLAEVSLEPAADKQALEKLQFMQEILNDNLSIDSVKFIAAFNLFYTELAQKRLVINEDTGVGLILHLACIIEALIKGESVDSRNLETRLDMRIYGESYAVVEKALRFFEDSFNVKLPSNEYYNVVKLIHFI
jgi:transcriptional regulatory protein LevR/transcriptional regulator with AAA-type ATPase domain